MPTIDKREYAVMFTCLPTVFFVIALVLIAMGMLGTLPAGWSDALDWTGVFALILALLLYGQAGLQAIES